MLLRLFEPCLLPRTRTYFQRPPQRCTVHPSWRVVRPHMLTAHVRTQLCLLLTLEPCTSILSPLGLHFLTSNMGVIISHS